MFIKWLVRILLIVILGAMAIALASADDDDDGHIGPQGPQGIQGPIGPKGSTGLQGAVGAQGSQGVAGSNTTAPAIDPRLDLEVREYDAKAFSVSSYASFGLQEGASRYIVGQRLMIKLGSSSEERELEKLREEVERLQLKQAAFLEGLL